jgi:hypothetical protein
LERKRENVTNKRRKMKAPKGKATRKKRREQRKRRENRPKTFFEKESVGDDSGVVGAHINEEAFTVAAEEVPVHEPVLELLRVDGGPRGLEETIAPDRDRKKNERKEGL